MSVVAEGHIHKILHMVTLTLSYTKRKCALVLTVLNNILAFYQYVSRCEVYDYLMYLNHSPRSGHLLN